jgi:hypothetical protein
MIPAVDSNARRWSSGLELVSYFLAEAEQSPLHNSRLGPAGRRGLLGPAAVPLVRLEADLDPLFRHEGQ